MSPNRLTLPTLCAAQFVLVLDVAVVNVALVPLAADLGSDPAGLQILGWSYAAAFGTLLLLGGRVADSGRGRWAFVSGLIVFALASMLCGAAPSVPILVAGRVLQGAGAAMASPAALSLLTAIYTDERARARALGVWAGVASAGGAAGLVLGGLLTNQLGWRSVFLVNVPVIVAVLLASRSGLPAGQPPYVRWSDSDKLIPEDVRNSRSTLLANVVTALMSATVIGTNFFWPSICNSGSVCPRSRQGWPSCHSQWSAPRPPRPPLVQWARSRWVVCWRPGCWPWRPGRPG